MQCTLCNGFEGTEKSVAAHICGSHDEDHQAFVGLNDQGKPLLRADHQADQEADQPEPTTKQVEPTGSSGGTAAVAGGLVGLGLLKHLTDGSNDRETM